MRELCPKHQLAIAPDGRCVLCRRPSLRVFGVREEHETAISRVFTGLLGVCLLVAASALIYVWTLDAGYTGGRYVAGPAPLAKLPGTKPAESPAPAAQADAGAVEAQEPEQLASAPAASSKPAPARPSEPLPPVQVLMYATPWCDICDRAREFLLARGAALTEHNVDGDPAAQRRLAKLNPSATVPTFEIAGRAYAGFNPWDLEDAMRAAPRAPATPAATARAGAARER